MSSEDIASQLLHSSDARIAEAAKRVFSADLASSSTYCLPSSSAMMGPSSRGGRSMFKEENPSLNHEEENEEEEEEDKKLSSTDRLKRSRERNRMHARKTRQRKKEHMQNLQNRADELKLEQIRLKQAINEKNTASILVGLFQTQDNHASKDSAISTDPRVDALLKRKPEDIPDASKIPELPALILSTNGSSSSSNNKEEEHCAGIDYKLLGKDRSSCSAAELDQIRRERNRMHAKRTRDRKRIFMEEMEVMIRQLEEENCLLSRHVDEISGNIKSSSEGTGGGSNSSSNESSGCSSLLVSPEFGPVASPLSDPVANPLSSWQYSSNAKQESTEQEDPSRGDFLNQIESLLAAAGAFEKRSASEINAISCAESDVTASSNNSEHDGSLCEEEEEEEKHVCKKKRVDCDVPTSITTTKLL